jgi:5'-3' exoribonuclease 2
MNQQRARRYMASKAKYGVTTSGGGGDGSFAPDVDLFTEDAVAQAQADIAAAAAALDVGIYGGSAADADAAPAAPKKSIANDIDPAVLLAGFDSNCISPGTVFMETVSAVLAAYCVKQIANADAPWWGESVSVILSDSNAPGEGEHKIVDFMRTHACKKDWPKGAHVIAGLDADLILLCLSLHMRQLYILRDNDRGRIANRPVAADADGKKKQAAPKAKGSDGDDDGAPSDAEGDAPPPVPDAPLAAGAASATGMVLPARRKKLEFFDMTACGDGVASELCSIATATHGGAALAALQLAPHRLINDFVALASLMGNDFMPRLPSGFCGEGAMDNMVETYVRHVVPHGFLTTDCGDVDQHQLLRWLKAYEPIETMLFRQHLIKRGTLTAAAAAAPVGSAVDAEWMATYRRTTTYGKEQATACVKYVEGMRFVLRYYLTTSDECSWSWFYPCHHGPLVHDLVEVLQRVVDSGKLLKAPVVELNGPPPFLQLLCILPPTSCRLLPPALRPLMLHPPEELAATFTAQWDVDASANSDKEHLSAPMTPFANMHALTRLATPLLALVDASDAKRNVNVKYHDLIVLGTHPRVAAQKAGALVHQAKVAAEAGEEAPTAVALDTVRIAGVQATVAATTPADAAAGVPEVLRCRFEHDKADADKLHPRGYDCFAPLSKLPRIPALANGKKKYGRFLALTGGVNAGDVLLADVAVAITAAVVFVPTWAAALSAATTLVFVGGTAVLLLLVTGMLDAAPEGTAPPRIAIRDIIIDWLCPACVSLNFGRNEQCFQCGLPYAAAACAPVFSNKNPADPPLYEADHSLRTSTTTVVLAPRLVEALRAA